MGEDIVRRQDSDGREGANEHQLDATNQRAFPKAEITDPTKNSHSQKGVSLPNSCEASEQSQNPLVFSYLSTAAYKDGLDLLIDALDHVDIRNAEFRIYGPVVEPNYFGKTMQRVKKGKNVVFYGDYSKSRFAEILSRTHIVVVPSREEHDRHLIKEIIHEGVPVIVSSIERNSEVVNDGKNGWRFKAGSIEDLAQKIQEVIHMPSLIDNVRRNIQSAKALESRASELEKCPPFLKSSHSDASLLPVTKSLRSNVTGKDMNPKQRGMQDEVNNEAAHCRWPFLVSIIIPVFNRIDLTKQCLTELANVTEGVSYEVIVVDNASTDGTHEFLASLEGDVQIVTNKKNMGFSKACNQGARVGKGKHLVFLNNDTVPLIGWLKALVQEIEADACVAVVGSKLLYEDNSIQHAGVVFSRLYQTPYHIFQKLPHDFFPANVRREFQAVTAACMLVRKETFEQVGGFDEGFVNGFEDVDLCLKIRRLGKKVIYQPKSCLYHLESQTEGRKTHDVANGTRLLAQWGHLWFIDEDIVASDSGYFVQQYVANGRLRSNLVPKQDVENQVVWQNVAKLQQLLLGKTRQPLKDLTEQRREIEELLSDIDGWPSDLGILEWVGRVCETLQSEAEAKGYWEKLLSIGDHPHARLGLARAGLKKGNLQEAQKHLDVLKNEFSPREDGWTLQGVLYIQTQEFLLAKDAFEMALQCEQSYERAQIGLGMACMGLGENEEAWTQFNQVLSQDPDNIEATRCLIQVGTVLERWESLFCQLRRFVERNPAASEIRFALAGVAVRAGHLEQAREQLSWFQLIKPDYEGLEDLANALNKVQEPTMSAQ